MTPLDATELANLKQSIAGARVLVVGDVMLDRYWFGDVERISPEAPVPVARIRRTEERAGGAANVARNIAALGGRATLLAVVGDDEPASSLERLLRENGVTTHLHRDPQIATTVKLRVLARQQQLLRIDFEEMPSHEVLASKLDEFRQQLATTDVVILSDYGKGGLKHVEAMIAAAREAGKPVLVDPKGDDYGHYRGATLLTPNRAEFRQVAGQWRDDADFASRARALRNELQLDALLVTRSEEGMSLFAAQADHHIPTVAREVYDVSGAGDTVIGTLGLMLAAGLDLPAAMEWSNRAAGIVVGKLGTAVVHPEELFA
ncbi:D-glycero-beta-D-manno-heptose-7-phosphate kinase [Chitiniphilus eburneus]|uniref:D-glycero-beta-D-manno-heptose-7-phosphate kinase n=1 Tax=Chitiniphilus eburneus TaxID=2571148 RepID=A0A4U0PZK0_9NEIS|nr:D-glycero-beta-D-manno-heptose-7-phosphate kinase [Chitiniphilus eburneus]TJZ74019.1 D-glycero-beta-D-manno-heptose-7-phosphate kinase [Chitiniphilus eburneus]